MERQILSTESVIVGGKARITTQTQETFSSAELVQLISREEAHKGDLRKEMDRIKAEYDKSTVRTLEYQSLLDQISPKADALPKLD